VARANIAALKSEVTDEFFNVGTGVQTSVKELCELMLKLTGSDLEIQYRPYDKDDARALVQNRIGSTKKIVLIVAVVLLLAVGGIAAAYFTGLIDPLISWITGDEEKKGGGLSDEIFNGIASGIPFLVAVPETNLDAWIERTGGAGAVLTFDESALWNWWNAIDGSARVDRR